MAPEGLIVVESNRPPGATMDRLAAAAVSNGMAILARIDHAAAAAQVGMDLRATEVLIFGNPKGGTPIMQDAPTAAIDLPLKALVWEDAGGTTWIAYNDPLWVGQRHGVDARTVPLLHGMADRLATIVNAAASLEGPDG